MKHLLIFLTLIYNITVFAQSGTTQFLHDSSIIAIEHVNVIPMNKEKVLPDRTVIIKDGIIRKIGKSGSVNIPYNAVTVDATGKYLIPGLSDMHTHLQNSGPNAETQLLLMSSFGITTIRNMDFFIQNDHWHQKYFKEHGIGRLRFEKSTDVYKRVAKLSGQDLLNLRLRAANKTIVSPRIYTSGPFDEFDGKDSLSSGTCTGIYDRLKAYKNAGFDFVKIHDELPVCIDSIIVAARQLDIPIVGHVANDFDINFLKNYKCVEHLMGYWKMEDLWSMKADVLDLPETAVAISKMAKQIKKQGIWSCPTLFVMSDRRIFWDKIDSMPGMKYVDTTVWEFWRNYVTTEKKTVERIASMVFAKMMTRALQQAGAGLLSGADVALSSSLLQIPGLALHFELQMLVDAGLTPYQALRTSTVNVARYFNAEQISGTIKRRKRADLALLSANPLENISNTMKIEGVCLDGKWFSIADFDRLLAGKEGFIKDWSQE